MTASLRCKLSTYDKRSRKASVLATLLGIFVRPKRVPTSASWELATAVRFGIRQPVSEIQQCRDSHASQRLAFYIKFNHHPTKYLIRFKTEPQKKLSRRRR